MKTKKDIELYYNELLFPMFPSEERDDLKNLLYYTKKQTALHKFKMLAAFEKNQIAGGVVFDYYKDTNCVLMEYISTKKEFRGLGVASVLLDKVTKKYKADYIIIEVEDPKKIQTDEAVNRLAFWKNRGFKEIDFDYVQPPINKAKPEVQNMLIMCKVLNDKYKTNTLPAHILEQTLKNYFSYSMRLKKSEINKFLNFDKKSYAIIGA